MPGVAGSSMNLLFDIACIAGFAACIVAMVAADVHYRRVMKAAEVSAMMKGAAESYSPPADLVDRAIKSVNDGLARVDDAIARAERAAGVLPGRVKGPSGYGCPLCRHHFEALHTVCGRCIITDGWGSCHDHIYGASMLEDIEYIHDRVLGIGIGDAAGVLGLAGDDATDAMRQWRE